MKKDPTQQEKNEKIGTLEGSQEMKTKETCPDCGAAVGQGWLL
jgi:hypothetical protein